MSFMRWAYIVLGLSMIVGALGTVPENVNSDDEMFRLAITMGTMMGFLMLFAGLGMGKHLKASAGSAGTAVIEPEVATEEVAEAVETAAEPEPKETDEGEAPASE